MNYYLSTINSVLEKTFFEQFFGTSGDWATRHNIFLDFMDYTGIFGTIIFIATSIILSMNYFMANLAHYSNWNINATIYTYFAAIALLCDNLVNSNLSLPYYTINIIIIYSVTIFSLLEDSSTDQ